MKQDMKVNGFNKAEGEHKNKNKDSKFISPEKKVKVRKEQMSIVLTPENKNKLRLQADNVGMSASELIAYWIEANEQV